jgi:hypothetical protein
MGKLMRTKAAYIFVIWLLPLPFFAQTPDVITMDQEPLHHLALHNDFVKVFKVEVSPGDSVVLQSHDQDAVAIAIGDQLVTVRTPGKPDVHQKNADAQVRLQRSGYIHSTHVDGDTPYHTVAVELTHQETSFGSREGPISGACNRTIAKKMRASSKFSLRRRNKSIQYT